MKKLQVIKGEMPLNYPKSYNDWINEIIVKPKQAKTND